MTFLKPFSLVHCLSNLPPTPFTQHPSPLTPPPSFFRQTFLSPPPPSSCHYVTPTPAVTDSRRGNVYSPSGSRRVWGGILSFFSNFVLLTFSLLRLKKFMNDLSLSLSLLYLSLSLSLVSLSLSLSLSLRLYLCIYITKRMKKNP